MKMSTFAKLIGMFLVLCILVIGPFIAIIKGCMMVYAGNAYGFAMVAIMCFYLYAGKPVSVITGKNFKIF